MKALDGRLSHVMLAQIQQLLGWLNDFTAKIDARLLNCSHLSPLQDVALGSISTRIFSNVGP